MGFERCHPAVNLLYFAAVLTGTVMFQHPAFLMISYLCAFLYSVKRNGNRALVFNLCLLPLIGGFSLYYSSYTHFGVTVLWQNMIGNNITLESLVYGLVLGVSAAGVCMWFSCIYSVFTTDKVIYLFGRISPRLSLFFAIILRMVPRTKKEIRKMNTARSGIGRGVLHGNLLQRCIFSIRILSMLLTWLIEALSTASESMRSRGSSLKGRKAFSIYRFDNRDRAYVIAMFLCMTLSGMARLLGVTDAVYDPQIRITFSCGDSLVFCIGYFILCSMPMLLELWTEHLFRKARAKGTIH